MALTYQQYAGNNIDTTQIARNGDIKLYYLDQPIDILRELDPEQALNLVSDLVDNSTRALNFDPESLGALRLSHLDKDVYNNMVPTSRYDKHVYNRTKNELAAMESKLYRPGRSDIKLLPRKIQDINDRLYVSGQSGSGKSTFCANYALEYQREFPGNKVFLFSIKNYDPVFDNNVPNLIRVPLDRKLLDINDITQYSDSLMIFDDFERVSDPHIKKAILRLKDNVFQLGRANNIYICSIQHKSLGGQKSIVDLQESNILVIFPKHNLGEAKKILTNYCSYDRCQIDRILDNDTRNERWLVIIKPNIIIAKNFIKIID